ncbi:MAG: hypothetical protein BGO93_15470 [Mesorhizobium sp. 65-26]|nr:MAG: hypothetical protein BGO93_15470 [Mesorhizobium sp. 65-26]
MLAFVKQAPDTSDGSFLPKAAVGLTTEARRKAMVEFVEALAIADARRDHFIASDSSIDRSSVSDSDHSQKAQKI